MEKDFKLALDKIKGGQYWKTCFNWVSPLQKGSIYLVEIGGKYMYYDWKNEKYLIDMSFDMAKPFCKNCVNSDYTKIGIDGKYNVLKIDGTIIFDVWVDWVDNTPDEGYWFIVKNNKWYVVSREGNMVVKNKIN